MDSTFLEYLTKLGAAAVPMGLALKYIVAQLLKSQRTNAALTRELIDNAVNDRKELSRRCDAERIESRDRIHLLEEKIEGMLITHLDQSTRAINALVEVVRSPSGNHVVISKLKVTE